jgi:ABC-type multidrug transport system ATPase subunit
MRRRLDLAGALVAEPTVLFLDEPTTGFDPRSRLGMWAILRELLAQGTTLLLTTQYLEEADQLADEIVVIDHGRAIARGTADQLKAQVGGERVELVVRDPASSPSASELVERCRDRGGPGHAAHAHPVGGGRRRRRRADGACCAGWTPPGSGCSTSGCDARRSTTSSSR